MFGVNGECARRCIDTVAWQEKIKVMRTKRREEENELWEIFSTIVQDECEQHMEI